MPSLVNVWSPGVVGWRISQKFGQNVFGPGTYDPWPAHQGVDVLMPWGTPVFAGHAGIVTWAGLDPRTAAKPSVGYGNYVEVTRADGLLRSRYCHFIAGSVAVRVGHDVTPGTKVGLADTTGFSNANHLHLELHTRIVTFHVAGYVGQQDGWGRIDPLEFLPGTLGGAGLDLPSLPVPTRIDVLQERLEKLERDRNLNYDKFIEAAADLGEAIRMLNRIPPGAIKPVDLVKIAELNGRWHNRV